MISRSSIRSGAREFVGGALVGMIALSVCVLAASAARVPVESALLVGAAACGGRGLWGQIGALSVAMAAGLALGGHAAGPLAAALGAGWLASFGEFARSEAWGFGHLRAAGRFLAAGALLLLLGQWLGWDSRGPLAGPVLGAAGLVFMAILGVELARNVRAASRAGKTRARRRPNPIPT